MTSEVRLQLGCSGQAQHPPRDLARPNWAMQSQCAQPKALESIAYRLKQLPVTPTNPHGQMHFGFEAVQQKRLPHQEK